MSWFSNNGDEIVKYNFDLWSYYGKFNFKGNKKQLILENNLKENIIFTHNAIESFNHCINQCLNFNNKVSFKNFEEIIKYVFIKMEGAKNNTNSRGYTEKTLVSDILRELINFGYGKNGKIIKVNDLEKLRNKNIKSSEIYKLTFGSLESNDSEEEKIDS